MPRQSKPASPRTAKPKTKKRTYTDAEKVAALLALEADGWNFLATAERIGIPRTNLQQWAKGDASYHVLKLRDRYRGDVIRQLKDTQWMLAGSVADPAAIKKAGLAERARAFALVFDRVRALEGKGPVDGGGVHVNVCVNLANMTDQQLEQYEYHVTAIEQLVGVEGAETAPETGEGPPEVRRLPAGDVPGDGTGAG